eukprot:gene19334-biopygen24149
MTPDTRHPTRRHLPYDIYRRSSTSANRAVVTAAGSDVPTSAVMTAAKEEAPTSAVMTAAGKAECSVSTVQNSVISKRTARSHRVRRERRRCAYSVTPKGTSRRTARGRRQEDTCNPVQFSGESVKAFQCREDGPCAVKTAQGRGTAIPAVAHPLITCQSCVLEVNYPQQRREDGDAQLPYAPAVMMAGSPNRCSLQESNASHCSNDE